MEFFERDHGDWNRKRVDTGFQLIFTFKKYTIQEMTSFNKIAHL